MISRDKILEKLDGKNAVLLAVSKKQPLEKIMALYEEGQRLFGENYVQELLRKKHDFAKSDIKWHLIGPLQINKVTKVVGEVELIHSVDSFKLANALSERAKKMNLKQDILIQINTSGEESKSGLALENCDEVLTEIFSLTGIQVRGFMTMPPFTDDPEASRVHFKKLRELRNKYADRGVTELSMGTTQDFEVAISEGATIIRVGEALFGARR